MQFPKDGIVGSHRHGFGKLELVRVVVGHVSQMNLFGLKALVALAVNVAGQRHRRALRFVFLQFIHVALSVFATHGIQRVACNVLARAVRFRQGHERAPNDHIVELINALLRIGRNKVVWKIKGGFDELLAKIFANFKMQRAGRLFFNRGDNHKHIVGRKKSMIAVKMFHF